jgi:hypothetical protein
MPCRVCHTGLCRDLLFLDNTLAKTREGVYPNPPHKFHKTAQDSVLIHVFTGGGMRFNVYHRFQRVL